MGSGRLSLLFRSFLIQGSWNYRTLIGTGVAWALLPVLRQEEERGPEIRDLQPDEPFNSHPYLTPVALGALVHARDQGTDPEDIRSFRTALRSPLGSLGDKLIWGAWRPMCLLAGMLAFSLGVGPLLVIGVTLVIYNGLHIALRVWGLDTGLRLGMAVGEALKQARLSERSERVESVGVLLFGILMGSLIVRGFELAGPGLAWAAGALTLAVVGAMGREAVRRWAPVFLLFLIVLGLTLLSGPLGAGLG